MYIATFPEDVMKWGATKVARLAHLRGFPESAEATTAVVRAVLRIAHPGLVKARIRKVQDPNLDKAQGGSPVPVERDPGAAANELTQAAAVELQRRAQARDAIKMSAKELEAITVSHPKLGEIKPLDWLAESVIESCRWFPSVPEMRDIFTRYLPAASDSAAEAQEGGDGG